MSIEMSPADFDDQAATSQGILRTDLNNRHIQMIAIGGVIGSGLFIGTGFSLAVGGPGNLLLGFAIIGVLLYFTMQALGELCVMYPVKGSFAAFSTRFIHPAWGFVMSWNYVMQWWIILPLEISGASICLQYWNQGINLSGFVALFLLGIVMLNCFGVKGYGEAESFFSMIKVLAVCLFIVLGIVINVGGSPSRQYYGTKTWRHPGAFYNGFQGFSAVLSNAAFAFAGTELVGLAANECTNPRRIMPVAIRQIVWRICFFYIVSLLIIGFLVPFTHPDLVGSGDAVSHSPFVIATTMSGLKGFGSFMNAVILVAAFSVANSSVFGSSRTLLALVEQGHAPACIGYIDSQGRPLASLGIALMFGVIAFVNTSPESSIACFTWIVALSGLSSIFTWGSICAAHIRFRGAWLSADRTIEELPFQATFGIAGSWIGLIMTVWVLAVICYSALFPAIPYSLNKATAPQQVNPQYFFAIYLAAPVIIVGFMLRLLYSKIRNPDLGWGFISVDSMDLTTGTRELPSLEALRAERADEAIQTWLPGFHKF